LTGERGVGKTTFCLHLIDVARALGLDVGGLISPAIFEEGQKVGISVLDIRNNQSRRLAHTREHITTGPNTKRWAFLTEAVEWGNCVLKTSTPCDLLIIDELGPLEFEKDQGWLHALAALDQGEYRLALVVIRPSLINQAIQHWPDAAVVEIEQS
ncbi:MAG: nucleoside-triphosphatase, partial [Chloroflexota bacterium]|nr:nucleoside-triphosphatase [Chloroflexota bacterium]